MFQRHCEMEKCLESYHGCCKACSQVYLSSGSFSIRWHMKSLAER